MPKRCRSSSSARLPTTSTPSLADAIVQELHQRANPQTKAWFTNYVKNTEWIGCKVPTVRSAVQDVWRRREGKTGGMGDDASLLEDGIQLLQHPACDAKLGGMMLLSEKMNVEELASKAVLDRFDADVWCGNHLSDWSSADWFSNRVLAKIGFSGKHDLAERILSYAERRDGSLWQRRCGVVSFLQYHKHRDNLPADFGLRLVTACEKSLQCSPEERFTQTGIAWVLRYVFLQTAEEQEAAFKMVCRNGSAWSTEAKKSLVEKLGKKDPRRMLILDLPG